MSHMLLAYAQHNDARKNDRKVELWDCLPYSQVSRKKDSNETVQLVDVLQMVVVIAAVFLAYRANARDGDTPRALAMAFVAATFPEIYILQAFIRWCLGTYTLP